MNRYLELARQAQEAFSPSCSLTHGGEKNLYKLTSESATECDESDISDQSRWQLPSYTPAERAILTNVALPSVTQDTIASIKAVFADMGGAQIVSIRDEHPAPGPQPDGSYLASDPARQPVIDLIRRIELRDPEYAQNLADSWKERVAICEIDGGLSPHEAESVALNDLRTLIGKTT